MQYTVDRVNNLRARNGLFGTVKYPRHTHLDFLDRRVGVDTTGGYCSSRGLYGEPVPINLLGARIRSHEEILKIKALTGKGFAYAEDFHFWLGEGN